MTVDFILILVMQSLDDFSAALRRPERLLATGPP